MWPISPNLFELVMRTVYYGLMLWFGAVAAVTGYVALHLLRAGDYTLPWGFLAVAGLSGLLAMAYHDRLRRRSNGG
ncbi:MAG: hypothetical protein ACE5IZ_04730 [Dehalococcoidia bacterium]